MSKNCIKILRNISFVLTDKLFLVVYTMLKKREKNMGCEKISTNELAIHS